MPLIDPRSLQKELEQGRIWPVIVITGPERLKARELLKRIRSSLESAAEKRGSISLFGGAAISERTFDATDLKGAQLLDQAQSLSLGGSTQLLIVQDAHLLGDLESLTPLLGPSQNLETIDAVVVLITKDLDQRKKTTKLLMEKAVVVACDEVPEKDREAWIRYLAQNRKVELQDPAVLRLRMLDPFSLDRVDQEIQKAELASSPADQEALLTGSSEAFQSNKLIDALFLRDATEFGKSLQALDRDPDEAFACLGLLNWTLTQLILLNQGSRAKAPPQILQKLDRFKTLWTLSELAQLNQDIQDLDFTLKQTPKWPLGAWQNVFHVRA